MPDPLKPCAYRAEHEFDADGLCVHCYAQIPEEEHLDISMTPTQEMPALPPNFHGSWFVPKDKP